MNHFLLPGAEVGSAKDSERLGVHLMELLVNGLLRQGAQRDRLEAKLFGGARMMRGLSDIGAQERRLRRALPRTTRASRWSAATPAASRGGASSSGRSPAAPCRVTSTRSSIPRRRRRRARARERSTCSEAIARCGEGVMKAENGSGRHEAAATTLFRTSRELRKVMGMVEDLEDVVGQAISQAGEADTNQMLELQKLDHHPAEDHGRRRFPRRAGDWDAEGMESRRRGGLAQRAARRTRRQARRREGEPRGGRRRSRRPMRFSSPLSARAH